MYIKRLRVCQLQNRATCAIPRVACPKNDRRHP